MHVEWENKAHEVSSENLKPLIRILLKGMVFKLGLTVLFAFLSITNVVLFFFFEDTFFIVLNWIAYAINVLSVRKYYKGYIYGGKVISFLMEVFGEDEINQTIEEVTYEKINRE